VVYPHHRFSDFCAVGSVYQYTVDASHDLGLVFTHYLHGTFRAFYLFSCRQPLPGMHDQFIHFHWKQTVGSLIHCVAGDATAIIIMAGVLHFFNVPNGLEVIIEYIAAYLFGLFIFQALFMRSMYRSYGQAVMKTIFVETVSMNMVMTGMFPVMLILEYYFPVSSDPLMIYFWGRMSLATIVGFIIAYPINSWLVYKNVKHGMMSKPSGDLSIHHTMKMASLSMALQGWTVIWTYAVLVVVLYVVSLFIPIVFTT
jgi:hypothetical protein